MKKIINIGSRGSNLALIQTKSIKAQIEKIYPQLECNIKIIKTYGDNVQDLPLDKLNDKGVFVKEIERELLDHNIDLAVHSMKDMPSEITPGLTFVNPPKSEDPSDVLILREGIKSLEEISGFKIGSGSKRRIYQLKSLIPSLEVVPIRGNIETRINKIESENLDGVILARAGILRAGYEEKISYTFDPKEFMPSPCQGILALQIRESDNEMIKILEPLAHRETTLRYEAERAFQKELGAGCHSPIGVYGEIEGDIITIYGFFGDSEGKTLIKDTIKGSVEDRTELAVSLAKSIKERL